MHCGADGVGPCCRPLQCLRFAPNFSVEFIINVSEIKCNAQKTMLRGTGEPNDSASRRWNSSAVSVKVQGSCKVVTRGRCQQTVHPCNADALTRQRLSHLTQKHQQAIPSDTFMRSVGGEWARAFTQLSPKNIRSSCRMKANNPRTS